MMSEDDFLELAAHLKALRPTFEMFCAQHGFEFVNRLALGRYPRIRIEKVIDNVHLWFDLWMCLDSDGNRYEKYFESIPYELSAGAFLDIIEEVSLAGHRYQIAFPIWERMPFSAIAPAVLVAAMEDHLPQLSEWNVANLRSKGKVIALPKR